MVTVKIDRKTGKCEIVDDAEETPGSSRQITRFRQYCLPILEEAVKKDKILKTTTVLIFRIKTTETKNIIFWFGI